MQGEGLIKPLSFSAQRHQEYYKQKWKRQVAAELPRVNHRQTQWPEPALAFICFSSHKAERNSCTSRRTDRGGLLNANHSSVFSEIQEQTQLRAPTICHLSPALSLQAELRWGSAAAATCKAMSGEGEAMQKDDYSLVFTIRELGSFWISQQVNNLEEALFPHNWTVEFVTMWFGGHKKFRWLPKAIGKHYGRKMHWLVSTVMEKFETGNSSQFLTMEGTL